MSYPYTGGGAVSAKLMNMIEQHGVLAVEVALAVLAHKESQRQVSRRKTEAGTVITVNAGEGKTVSILADESTYFTDLKHRRGN